MMRKVGAVSPRPFLLHIDELFSFLDFPADPLRPVVRVSGILDIRLERFRRRMLSPLHSFAKERIDEIAG